MLETKEQKQYFYTIIALIVILVVVSIWHRPTPKNTPVDISEQAELDYEAYLASLEVDPVASEQLFKKIISEEDVREEVGKTLGIGQPIQPPVIDESKLSISNKTGQTAVIDYFKSSGVVTKAWADLTEPKIAELFDPLINPESTVKLQQETVELVEQYYQIPVPKEVLAFHKAHLTGMQSYIELLSSSSAYQADPFVDPWPQTYKNYVVMDDQVKTMDVEYNKLDQKYGISNQLREEMQNYAQGGFVVTSAQAAIPVIDIKAIVRSILDEVLATTFARFAVAFLDKLITSIEKNYQVANFLYYTDAVASGQYVDDYLDKYLANEGPVGKAIAKNFIPEISCGVVSNEMKNVFKAKSLQHLGFSPDTLDTRDPYFYDKMARMGNFLSSPSGWQLYYQDVASQAQTAAKQAASQELVSQGFKSSRESLEKGKIATSGVSALASLRAAFQSYLTLGNSNAQSMAGRIASVALQVFYNKFLFKGAVLKEQDVCIGAPQVRPVVRAGGNTIFEVAPPQQQIPGQKPVERPEGVPNNVNLEEGTPEVETEYDAYDYIDGSGPGGLREP